MLKYQQTKILPSDMCLPSIAAAQGVAAAAGVAATSGQVICIHATVEDTMPALDTGSALISNGGNELIGIAFWQKNDFPNVFSRIRPYTPWIKSVILE